MKSNGPLSHLPRNPHLTKRGPVTRLLAEISLGYISLSDVRVYLKDTLRKDYSRHKHADGALILRVLGLSDAPTVRSYIKPHGRRFADGRIVCWGRANAWKNVLMAAYERAYSARGDKPFAAVLTRALGQYHQPSVRKMVECAATKLGIERVVWLEQ